MKTTVLLVDDHTVVRQGLRALLQSQPDFEVVGEAENGRDAISLAAQLQPQVVLMDVAMPSLNGHDATRRILRAAPQAKVLVLSGYSDDDCVSQMLAAGAAGYLLKQTAANELPTAIREVRRGAHFLSLTLVKQRQLKLRRADVNGVVSGAKPKITCREEQVLQLIAEGFSNKEMAAKLAISTKTIEKHRQQVMKKLDIHEVAGLTRFAIAHGYVDHAEPLVA